MAPRPEPSPGPMQRASTSLPGSRTTSGYWATTIAATGSSSTPRPTCRASAWRSRSGWRVRPGSGAERHHPHPRHACTPDGQQRRPGVGPAPGGDPDDAPGVLVRIRRRAGDAQVSQRQRPGGRLKIAGPQADVDHRDGSGERPRGRHHEGALENAEAHRHVRMHGEPGDLPGVGVDPAGHVHRHDGHTGRQHGANHSGRGLTNRSGPADAQDPVEDQISGGDDGPDLRIVPGEDARPRRSRRAGTADVHALRVTDRGRCDPPSSEVGQGPQGITAVVPGADEGHHACPTNASAATAHEVEADTGQGRRRALHEHRLGHSGPRFSPPDHLNRTDRAHLHLPASCLPHGTVTRRRTTRTIRITRHIGNVRHGPTRDRVGGRRIPPPPILPQPGRERGTQVPLGSHGSPARRNPRGPGSTRRTTGRGLLRVHECAHGTRQLTSQAMRDTR